MPAQPVQRIGLFTATSLVIANMVGTGVFTSLGFQLVGLSTGMSLLLLWLVGGIAALTGALVYGEIGSRYPKSGGEYNYLSRIYHPLAGFLSGWVSATVGFAAPVAAASVAMGTYVHSVFPEAPVQWLAALVVVSISLIHSIHFGAGKAFQNLFTSLKVIMIISFIIAGLLVPSSGDTNFVWNEAGWKEIWSPAFAISLFFVSYSYSGWNAAAYMAGEIKNPQKNLPRALFAGTALVTCLYVLLNYVFLRVAPQQALSGQLDVGSVAASFIFGESGGKIMSMIIALLLVSSISSMIMVGPRVNEAMGKDYSVLSVFAQKSKLQIPVYAIAIQCFISLIFIFSSTFEQVITYLGFTLNLFLFLTVAGLFVVRLKKSNGTKHYKTWGYPVVPVVYLALGSWLLVYGLVYKPTESAMGFLTVFSGLLVYIINQKFYRDKK